MSPSLLLLLSLTLTPSASAGEPDCASLCAQLDAAEELCEAT